MTPMSLIAMSSSSTPPPPRLEAMERAQVLDWTLQEQLAPYMREIVPLPGVYNPDFIAANQVTREGGERGRSTGVN